MSANNDGKGICFNIQSYSVHDGPGIRTILFMKGCPLRCTWCCNPESQRFGREVGYSPDKCLGCGRCAAACPHAALALSESGVTVSRDRCDPSLCDGQCAAACPSKAMILYGFALSPGEALDKVERDSAFYARSGGGMTLSGGEPFAQPEFLMAVLLEAERRAVNVAVETCGFAPAKTMIEACKHIDYLLFDLKHPDPDIHEKVTGVSNRPILENLKAIRRACPSLPIHVRTPVIPGVNDSPETIEAIARLAREAGAVRYELLPFHRMGEQKYCFLGREYAFRGRPQFDAVTLEPLVATASRHCPSDASPETE